MKQDARADFLCPAAVASFYILIMMSGQNANENFVELRFCSNPGRLQHEAPNASASSHASGA
jgi:hypothetical protein